jgi:pyrroloquinoline quinone (PQQ) biosynthesis protein C
MGHFERCHDELAPIEQKLVREHGFIGSILDKKSLTKSHYAAYLRETYHLVHETPLYLAAAAANCGEDAHLRDWFLDFAVDERGHDLLCVHDLKKLGADVDVLLRRHPDPGAWLMIAQNHHLARSGRAAGIIGFAAATEGLGASLARGVGAQLEDAFPFTRGATSFLKVHGHEDQKHIAIVKTMFERQAEDPQTRDLMKSIWRMTLVAYGQLFSDVIAQGAEWLGKSPSDSKA